MNRFNMLDLVNWEPVKTGDLIKLVVPRGTYRNVAIDLMTDREVSVIASHGKVFWPVAVGSGMIEIRFGSDFDVNLSVHGDNALVVMRTQTETQVVPASDEESYTTMEPQQSGPSAEIRRIEHMMRINSRRREQQLLAEINRLHEKGTPSPALADPTMEDIANAELAKAAAEKVIAAGAAKQQPPAPEADPVLE